ncbi:hypothetical protein LOAG_05363 [Loa loa]|nr:hypothetical protein LOAG_05363 [Loa loa]EFO23124.1 hypothetical protein LOAG_05363 [Loa loa]
MAVSISLLCDDDLKLLESVVDKGNETFPKYNAFGDLCLYSVYIANSKTDKARVRCDRMLKALFFHGQPLTFLIRCDWDADRMQTLERLQMLLEKEPENYLAHILMYQYHFKHDKLNCALAHAYSVLKYWPYHMNPDNLSIHIREYVHCRLLEAVQEELNLAAEVSLSMKASFSSSALEEGIGKKFCIEMDVNECKNNAEIVRQSDNDFSVMGQFQKKLEAIARQECGISKFSTEKGQDLNAYEAETPSTSNSQFLDNSGKYGDSGTSEEKAENVKGMIGAAFIYAEQLRREIEHGSRMKKDQHRCEDITVDKDFLIKGKSKCEKSIESNERNVENGDDSDDTVS